MKKIAVFFPGVGYTCDKPLLYYTASMAAQVATPMVSGYLLDKMGMSVLFPYAAIFVALAFVTMVLVKHGDSKEIKKKGLEALDIDD